MRKSQGERHTPLNAIIGLGELLAQEALGPIAQRQYVEPARSICSARAAPLAAFLDAVATAEPETADAGGDERSASPGAMPRLSGDVHGDGIRHSGRFFDGTPSSEGMSGSAASSAAKRGRNEGDQ